MCPTVGPRATGSRSFRWNVLVASEHIVGIVLGFDPTEPVPGSSGVGSPNSLLSLICEEADVPAEIVVR